MKKKFNIGMFCGILACIMFSLLALCLGALSISVKDVISVLCGNSVTNPNASIVIWNVRIPRILLSLLAGAGLSVAGAAFQALFSNPLATPDTLGCANGASFGAALGILLGFSSLGVQISALAFGIVSVVLVFLITSGKQRGNIMMVVLAGMVVSSLFSALVSFVKYVADPNDVLPVITFWLMGSLTSASMKNLITGGPVILIGIFVLYKMRYRLNILSLREEEAKSMGISIGLNRTIVIVCASFITASIVSMCGVIGWIGLLIPHISRMAFGNNNTYVIPSCIVFGALFMVSVDTIARCLTASEIPVSILTAIIGAPVFLILLRKTGGIRV